MFGTLWKKITGKKDASQTAPETSQPQPDVFETIKEFKGSKKELFKMMRNPAVRQRVAGLMEKMSKDGVDVNNQEQIKQWIEKHKDELSTEKGPAKSAVTQVVRAEPKIGRNDPCLCGSGKKYKKCCALKEK